MRRSGLDALASQTLVIDGLNVITTIEVALAGGVLLLGRDGCMRDMASFHGSYRLVDETERAVDILVELIETTQAASATVYIDQPVSNSGRLAEVIRRASMVRGSRVRAVTAHDVDGTLARSGAVVATADSAVLDRCGNWVNLARSAVEGHWAELPRVWLLDLS